MNTRGIRQPAVSHCCRLPEKEKDCERIGDLHYSKSLQKICSSALCWSLSVDIDLTRMMIMMIQTVLYFGERGLNEI